MLHEQREVGARSLDEVALANVRAPSKRRAARSTAVEHMVEAALHEFLSQTRTSATDLGGRRRVGRLERLALPLGQPVRPTCAVRVADHRLDAHLLQRPDLVELAVPLVRDHHVDALGALWFGLLVQHPVNARLGLQQALRQLRRVVLSQGSPLSRCSSVRSDAFGSITEASMPSFRPRSSL